MSNLHLFKWDLNFWIDCSFLPNVIENLIERRSTRLNVSIRGIMRRNLLGQTAWFRFFRQPRQNISNCDITLLGSQNGLQWRLFTEPRKNWTKHYFNFQKISIFVEFERKTTFVVIFLNMDRILYGSSYFHVNQSSLTYGGKKSFGQVIDYH